MGSWLRDVDLEGLRGPALTDALLERERQHGMTTDVAWAYAEALPLLLPDLVSTSVVPMAFGRGGLRAALVPEPVSLPGVVHVQTESPEVCAVLGPDVRSVYARGRPCLERLIAQGRGVRRVFVRGCEPFEVEAPFEVTFVDDPRRGPYRWFEPPRVLEYFVPVVRLDREVWLCWDRDLRRACIVRIPDTIIEGRHGPRDVAPEAEPPPWADPVAHEARGRGWAGTGIFDGHRSLTSMRAGPGCRWLCLDSFEDGVYHRALEQAWRAREDMRGVEPPGQCMATYVSLELDEARARFHWIGNHRVLRIREHGVERLTADHDLRSALIAEGKEVTEEMEARLETMGNFITRALPKHEADEGACALEAGDRFVLLDATGQDCLTRAAGGPSGFARRMASGSVRDVARWARGALDEAQVCKTVVVVDADAQVEMVSPAREPDSMQMPRARELLDHPERYDGRHIRARGLLSQSIERHVFAGAWFSGDSGLGYGRWLVEAEGRWACDGRPRGHFDFYQSELDGRATLVPIDQPRPIAAERIRFARPYVPLIAEVTLERRLQGWTYAGRLLHRLGPDARLPEPEVPDRCRARIVFMVDAFHHYGLFRWEILEQGPLAPERSSSDDLGPDRRYVELEGVLTPGPRWPRLDDRVEVVPPSAVRGGDRHTIPSRSRLDPIERRLGDGVAVVVRGEVAKDRIFAISIVADGEDLEL